MHVLYEGDEITISTIARIHELMRIIITVMTALLISSCASIMDGTKQRVAFDSKPRGAQVFINGFDLNQKTPFVYSIERKVSAKNGNSENEYVYIFKKEGYVEKIVRDSSRDRYDAYSYLNYLYFWGFLIDSYTGADRIYSDTISVMLEPDYGYMNSNVDKMNENEGIVFGEIQIKMGGQTSSVFDISSAAAVGYCQPGDSLKNNLTRLGPCEFTLNENDGGRFYIKLPKGSYSLTHIFVPSLNTCISPFDTLYLDSEKKISKVDTAYNINFDVVPQQVTYIGTLSIAISAYYDLEYLCYIGYADQDNNIQYNKHPEIRGGNLLINTPGQLKRFRLNTKEYELLNETVNDRKLSFTYRKKDSDTYKFIYGTDKYSISTHWAITNEDKNNSRLFQIKYPNITSEIRNNPAQMIPVLK